MQKFVDRLAIADRLDEDIVDKQVDNADKGEMADFLETIVKWSRAENKNILKEEDCMILNFGQVFLFLQSVRSQIF